LIVDGVLDGNVDVTTASARVSGRQLRELASGLGDDGRSIAVGREGHVDEASLQQAIADHGWYFASAVEV